MWYHIILDAKRLAVCIARITGVSVTCFNLVTERQTYLEGEGDSSLKYRQEEHRKFFTADLAEAGIPFHENMSERVYPV